MRPVIFRSNGETSARAYVRLDVPVSRAAPLIEDARVVLVDPHRTETVSGLPRSSGPRDPQQSAWPAPRSPGIELPDGRPLMKAQRIWIDPDLIEQWEREAAAMKGQGTG